MEQASSRLLTPSGIVLSDPKAKPSPAKKRNRNREPNMKLREARINARLSPNQLGYRAGRIAGKTVRDAEAGRVPHPGNQAALAAVLGMKASDLFPVEVPQVIQ